MTYIINGVMIMAILCVATSRVQVDPSYKLQASSAKLQELLAASLKPQATSGKLQAASLKLHDTRALIKFQATSVR
jgi:hypothetical protein